MTTLSRCNGAGWQLQVSEGKGSLGFTRPRLDSLLPMTTLGYGCHFSRYIGAGWQLQVLRGQGLDWLRKASFGVTASNDHPGVS